MKFEKKNYFEKNWMFKTHIIINYYVVLLFNFEIHIIQRNKIMHFVVKIIFNDQMSFETIFRYIRFELRKMYRFIRERKKEITYQSISWREFFDFSIFYKSRYYMNYENDKFEMNDNRCNHWTY